mmetsp:Transcript_25833/g.61622  ORF Transcript_25833/g.61622 Transcript_25833/m.61622 type:complete len:81 (+) Transcript_25833:365-607(+)
MPGQVFILRQPGRRRPRRVGLLELHMYLKYGNGQDVIHMRTCVAWVLSCCSFAKKKDECNLHPTVSVGTVRCTYGGSVAS